MISVIIPSYNSSQTLNECLTAVFNNKFENFEVIVVDDKSNDNSIEIAKNFNCKIIELKENKGPAFARNTGANVASGDILLFTDSDVIIKNDALMNVNKLFENNKETIFQGIYSHETNYKNISTQYQQSFYSYYTWSPNNNYTDQLTSCYFAIAREKFFECEGFNTKIKRATAEDEEFGYKLVDKGYKIFISRELSAQHKINYTLLKFIKRNFIMYIDTGKLYLRNLTYIKKRVKQNRYFNPLMALGILGLIVLLLPIMFFYPNAINFNIFFTLNFIFLLFHLRFINFVKNEKGLLIACKIVLICYLDAFLMLLGTLYGSVIYFLGRKY